MVRLAAAAILAGRFMVVEKTSTKEKKQAIQIEGRNGGKPKGNVPATGGGGKKEL